MNRSNKRKTIKIVNNNLDGIYNAAKSIAKDWSQNVIPLITLWHIIDKSKPSITTDKSVNAFNESYSKTLDILYIDLTKVSKAMNSENIALSEILKGITVIKEAFKTGLNKEQ